MERSAVLQADYLDILFDQRNKNYGGYQLRKQYPKRVKRAILFVVLSSGLISIFSVFGNTHVKPAISYNTHGPVKLVDLSEKHPDLPKPILPKPTAPPPLVNTAVAKITPPTVVPDKDVAPKELMSSVEDLKHKQIGDENRVGDPTGSDISAPESLTKGGGTGGGGDIGGDGPPPPPLKWVEQMPVFDGDMDAFLRDHMRYPDAAREAGIQGRVVLQFVVNEDGAIVDIKSLKGIGGGCEEEAICVVSAMPRWRPGKNNGRPVRVMMTLPVTFTLE